MRKRREKEEQEKAAELKRAMESRRAEMAKLRRERFQVSALQCTRGFGILRVALARYMFQKEV